MADFREAIGNATQAQPETSETLGKFAPASIAAASRRVNRALRRASNGGLQELHQTRIQIKRLRYLVRGGHSSALPQKTRASTLVRLQAIADVQSMKGKKKRSHLDCGRGEDESPSLITT